MFHVFAVEHFATFKHRERDDARIVEPEFVMFGKPACFLVDFQRQWHDLAELRHIAQEDVDLLPREPIFRLMTTVTSFITCVLMTGFGNP